ncbi:hypothetical protein EDC04DRAFT_2887480 [Pisolithus marmoratus]|nr:hypothetical protein EDC04DRAFT_2887480 [Pisolithus marmoratus]
MSPSFASSQLPRRQRLLASANISKKYAPKEVREVVLANIPLEGLEPLTILDIQATTLGILYILSAWSHVPSATRPPPNYTQDFCSNFEPAQARFAADRIALLALGIAHAAEREGNLQIRVASLAFIAALPVLAHSIKIIDLTISELTCNDNLVYHYAGGMVYAALRWWAEAEEYFEIRVCDVSTFRDIDLSSCQETGL